MLDQPKVRTGHRVLEMVAGIGYNAALLAHIVGRRAGGRLLSGGAGHLLEVVEYRVAPDEDLGGWFESDGEMTV
jgi:hypothetical protein